MTVKEYSLGLSHKESIILQLRVMLPTINFSDLEKAYYVYVSQKENIAKGTIDPTYLDYWVKENYCPNLNSARAVETRLSEKNVIVELEKPSGVKDTKKKNKGLPLNIFKNLCDNDLTTVIKIKVLNEEDN